jgi:hypothetical protein
LAESQRALERFGSVAKPLKDGDPSIIVIAIIVIAQRGFEAFLREPHVAGGEVVHMKKWVEL